MKGKVKEKSNVDKLKKKSVVPQDQAALSSTEIPKNESLDFWKSEVQAMSGQHFASIDEAIESIIDKVIARLNLNDEKEEETRVFLGDLLNTDPRVTEQLSQILKIG